MNQQLQKKIIEFLVQLPFLQTEEGIRNTLCSAGFGDRFPDIDLSGSTQESLKLLITTLESKKNSVLIGESGIDRFLQEVERCAEPHQATVVGKFRVYAMSPESLSDETFENPSEDVTLEEIEELEEVEEIEEFEDIEEIEELEEVEEIKEFEDIEEIEELEEVEEIEEFEDIEEIIEDIEEIEYTDEKSEQNESPTDSSTQPRTIITDRFKKEPTGIMKLTGQQYKHLQQAMLDAFPTEADLQQMVTFELGENLATIASGGNLQEIVFKLIGWAQAHGKLEELIQGAIRHNPGNQALQKVTKTLLLSVPSSQCQESIVIHDVKCHKFSFETVKVNSHGAIIARKQYTAQYYTEDLDNGVILEMVAIPGGTFLMGAPESEKGSVNDERPQHQVAVSPFFMGKYPVTQAQWKVVMGYNLASFRGPQRPVEAVSWLKAMEFCQRISEKTGAMYRLPTEAEWEYACRAGTTTPFYFGETITIELANCENMYDGTTEVGKFPPNAFGLYDMHGNVSEWCKDNCEYDRDKRLIVTDTYKDSVVDPVCTSGSYRVNRGGSWKDNADGCRAAGRDYGKPDIHDYCVGFRLVRTSV